MKALFTTVAIALTVGVLNGYSQEDALQVELLEEGITGLALYPDGETAVSDMPVRVWSVDKKEVIFRSRTDDNGNFSIPKLDSGQNYLFIGRVRVNLKIFKGEAGAAHQHHDIIMVVSRGMVIPARPNVLSVLMAPLIMKIPDDPPVISP